MIKKKKYSHLTPQRKEDILNVLSFFEQEKRQNHIIISLKSTN